MQSFDENRTIRGDFGTYTLAYVFAVAGEFGVSRLQIMEALRTNDADVVAGAFEWLCESRLSQAVIH